MKIKTVTLGLLLAVIAAGGLWARTTRAKETFPQVDERDPAAEEGLSRKELGLDEFIMLAAQNDDRFELILINELNLKYEYALGIPSRDLVFSVRNDYNYYRRQFRGDRETEISLSKLFPYIGTEVSAAYETTPGFVRRQNVSAMTLLITQPIAENAFGRAVRLRDKIIGLEIEVARYQIVEAYEDYLALLINAYFLWYKAYEDFKVGDSSYRANLKLQENMEARMKSNIALPIDVNKITLLVLAKKETLIDLRTTYDNALNFIEDSMGYAGGEEALVPTRPELYEEQEIDFETGYARFEKESRTARVLRSLEDRSSLVVKEEFDDLLPSINLRIGNTWDWIGSGVEREDHLLFAGVQMDWSFFEQVDRAEYNNAKIDRDRSRITTENTLDTLYVSLKNISQQVKSQRELALISAEKSERARSVLADETENYSFGKVTLNDYIDAVNVYDDNRFNRIGRDVAVRRLVVEWLRLSDQLISRKEIDERRRGDR